MSFSTSQFFKTFVYFSLSLALPLSGFWLSPQTNAANFISKVRISSTLSGAQGDSWRGENVAVNLKNTTDQFASPKAPNSTAEKVETVQITQNNQVEVVADTFRAQLPQNFQVNKPNYTRRVRLIEKPKEAILELSQPLPAGYQQASKLYQAILEESQNGTDFVPVDGFRSEYPVQIDIKYAASDLTGLDTNSLRTLRWTGEKWRNDLSNCTHDSATQTVSCKSLHLNTFVLTGQKATTATLASNNLQITPASGTNIPIGQSDVTISVSGTNLTEGATCRFELKPVGTGRGFATGLLPTMTSIYSGGKCEIIWPKASQAYPQVEVQARVFNPDGSVYSGQASYTLAYGKLN